MRLEPAPLSGRLKDGQEDNVAKMTGAERQRRYRDKKKRERQSDGGTGSRHSSTLGAILETATKAEGVGLPDLTVMSDKRDPYRLDTKVSHLNGRWAAEQLARFYGSGSRTAHWRGLHYSIIMAPKKPRKPNGELGETSDTFVYQIARDAVADGRPLVVFTLTDCDPSGWQMFISIARKLQAMQDLHFPELQWEIVPVALMPEQLLPGGSLSSLNLPQEPIKKGDKRAAAWKAAFGIEQTEIDALTTPEMTERGILRGMIEDAFAPYIDATLAGRVTQAASKWQRAAQAAVDAQADLGAIATLQEEAERLRERAGEINAELATATEDVVLPDIEVPESRVDLDRLDNGRQAVVKFSDDWLAATRALIARKQYFGGDDD
jgi:hypothetical protein